MYCQYCGAEFQEVVKYCPNCGAAQTETPSSEVQIPVLNTQEDAKKNAASESVMTWGILALIFACIPSFVLLGLIFSIVAMNKSAEYKAQFGEPEGRAKTGSNLAKAGLIVSIVMLAFLVLCFLFGFIMGLTGSL